MLSNRGRGSSGRVVGGDVAEAVVGEEVELGDEKTSAREMLRR